MQYLLTTYRFFLSKTKNQLFDLYHGTLIYLYGS